MKVRELIARLDEVEPDADVYLIMQEGWPFEVSIAGVWVRKDLTDCEPDEDPGAETPVATVPWSAREGRQLASDVFAVERRQESYGNRAALEVARRY